MKEKEKERRSKKKKEGERRKIKKKQGEKKGEKRRKNEKEGESKREKEKEIIPLLSWVKFQKNPIISPISKLPIERLVKLI